MNRIIGAILIGAAALAMHAGVARADSQVALPKIQGSYLVVQTNASVEVPADTVRIHFWIEANADALPEAKNAHLAIAGKVAMAITALGVAPDQLESTDYSSRRKTKWDQATNTEIFISNAVSSSLQVTTSDFELVPRIIDAALGAGASRVSGFDFESTKEADARVQAIEKATENARIDAKTLAKAAGVALGSIHGVFLDPSDYQWELGIPSGIQGRGGPSFGQSVFKSEREAEELVFQPEPVTVYATVRLVYETKPIQ